jgi:hypothetical protein
MMDESTWMTAEKAKEHGLCDEVQDIGKALNAVINGNFMVVNSVRHDLARVKNAEQLLKMVEGSAKEQTPPQQQAKDSILNEAQKLLAKAVNLLSPKNNNEEGTELEIKTIEDLKKTYPDMVNQIASEAVANAAAKDKERIDALNALAVEGNQQIAQLIEKAKNSGKTAEDINDAVEIMKQQPAAPKNPINKGEELLKKAIKDSVDSGVNGVESSATPGTPEQAEELAAINFMGSVIAKKCGKEGAK